MPTRNNNSVLSGTESIAKMNTALCQKENNLKVQVEAGQYPIWCIGMFALPPHTPMSWVVRIEHGGSCASVCACCPWHCGADSGGSSMVGLNKSDRIVPQAQHKGAATTDVLHVTLSTRNHVCIKPYPVLAKHNPHPTSTATIEHKPCSVTVSPCRPFAHGISSFWVYRGSLFDVALGMCAWAVNLGCGGVSSLARMPLCHVRCAVLWQGVVQDALN